MIMVSGFLSPEFMSVPAAACSSMATATVDDGIMGKEKIDLFRATRGKVYRGRKITIKRPRFSLCYCYPHTYIHNLLNSRVLLEKCDTST